MMALSSQVGKKEVITIGFYDYSVTDAQGNEVKLNLNLEKVNEWVGKGAQLSDRVKKLVKDAKANA